MLRRLSSPAKARDASAGLGGGQADALSQSQLEVSSPRPERQLREDHERAASLYQRSASGSSRSPTRQLEGAMADRPKRTPVKPRTRPLPPPGADDDDDILNPFAGRVLRRSPLVGLAEPDHPEPELPPTPVDPDHAASTPPTGIHSTPSRQPRRSRALAAKIRSSPMKHPPTKPAADIFRHEDEHILPTTEADPLRATVRPHDIPRGGREVVKARSKPMPRPSNVRGVETAGAEAEKIREQDALQIEVAQLERDLDVVAQENERIRQLQLSRKEMVMARNSSDIFDVLERHLGHRKKDSPTGQSAAWLQAALDPISFLPFGKPSSALPTLFQEDISAEPEHEPISHHPISLTARESLPFLQAFTPLSFTSHVTIDPYPTKDPASEDGLNSDTALVQHHSITAKAAFAPGLFSARIDVTVNAMTHTVTSISVPFMNPPSAAGELSPLAAKILADPKASSSALSRNVGVLTWAMGSWLRVAVRRAKVWRTLDRELGTPDAVIRTVARVKAGGNGWRRKYQTGSGVDDHSKDGGENDADSDNSADCIGSLVNTDDLLPYMGQLWMDLAVPSSAQGKGSGITTKTDVSVLRIQWRIEFDWSGEATSQIRALVSLPGKCKT